ncbi:ras-associating and dilute domain-containing protein-like isoform X3 [Hippocampus zosterae]|uniref:ras-associating and dilute domain-containing protein-like isoform X3 n=1 Tax=Hippocampus zosterae TaxID=109293 RepID=UPI00223CB6BE|nr:ras-associating and dilute domain-containing protein-like isoform X3 [Hippocampus zosterae]
MSLRNDEELRSFPRRGLSSSSTSSLKRRLVRLARKSSDGSLRSSSSTGSSSTGRSAEAVAFRQPCKSRIRHHTNPLSGVFLRGAASGSLSVAMSAQIGKGSDAEIVDDPSELSNQLSAPGILKIFGSEICKGAYYKSVLATTHSSAKELVKEALERYGFGKDEASSYVLCDTIGSISARLWKTEGFRVVGDNEKPLLLQSLWKPREGLARRFEIQRRSLVEEQSFKEQDTITAGINAQARKLQKSRSRVNSTLVERTMSQSQKLWRSKSEMDLIEADSATKANEDQSMSLNGTLVESHKCSEARAELNDIDHAVPSKGDGGSQAKTETLYPPRPRGEQEGEESEREETESSDDNTTQYSIHPPQDCPYLLLLHGRSLVQEQTKKLAAFQKEVNKDAITRLLPLVVWMSNSLEVLQFIQYQLPVILEWRTCEENEDRREGEFGENLDLLELQLSSVHSTAEETVAALEEVIMLTFQQCVYYVTKVLYPILPAFLYANPFKEGHSLNGKGAPVLGSSGLTVPDQVQQVVEVLSETQRLLSDCQLHPEISTQLIAFLFYFINASLFNLLMEKGSEPGFYQRSTAICIRTNFDLLLNWSRTTGLGKLALELACTLSSAINLLTTPRKNLLQTSWASLRSEFPALNAAQLNHLLSFYSPTCPTRHTWTPCARDQTEAHRTDDILQSFDTHHPLVLPDGGYQFMVGRAVTDLGLVEHLNKLKDFIFNLPNLQSHGIMASNRHQGITMETKSREEIMATTPIKTVFCQPTVQTLPPSSGSPPSPASPSLHSSVPYLDEFNSCGALLLSRKLRNLQLQTRDTTELRKSTLDPSCLLTPPNTPLTLDPVHWVKEDQDQDAHSWSSDVGAHDEGGLMFECLAALKDDRFNQDYTSMKRIFELIEEEEEEAEETGNHFDDNNDEIFSLELERDKSGLGLALVDTRDMSLKVKGIFIRAVVPDTPAARCEKLQPGDRILAVNGVSLLGPHCLNGKELMQSSGDRLRLLVARSDWMAKVIQTEC